MEENFSYIRVFDCSVPPHALPKILPDRLVCQEVAYQTVVGEITKELKAAQKKVWPTFPIQVGMFTLLDFGHTKVEAAALEDVKLVDIEFKRHDPHKLVENHLAQFNMKRYIHEESPYDEVFRGDISYENFKIDYRLCLLTNRLVSSASKSIDETTCLRFYKEIQGPFHLHRKLNPRNLSQVAPLKTKLKKY
jgi:hypothetical protein